MLPSRSVAPPPRNFDYPGLVLIESKTLTAAAASISFQSIPAGFRVLEIFLAGRGDAAATSTGVFVRFNNDSGSNYHSNRWRMDGSGVITPTFNDADTGLRIFDIPANTAPTSAFSSNKVLIPAYSNNNIHKSVNSSGFARWGTTNVDSMMSIGGGTWKNTAPINRIDLVPVTGNLVSVSVANLYAWA